MISKTDGAYKHIIAYSAEKNHFTKVINDKDVKDLYSNTLKANANRNNTGGANASKGKVMVIEDDCTAFYLLETWYNEYGEIIEIYQHYLYTICEGMIDGGGEEEEEEFIPDFGYSVSVDEGGEAEETSTIGTDTYKVARRTWIFHDGYTYWGKSREKLMVKVSNGVRTWHSITHEEYIK